MTLEVGWFLAGLGCGAMGALAVVWAILNRRSK